MGPNNHKKTSSTRIIGGVVLSIFIMIFVSVLVLMGGSWSDYIFTGIFVGIFVVGIGGYAIYKFMETFYVTQPDINFNPPHARLGETVTMSYMQSFKRSARIKRIDFKVVFRETAKYQVGTDTRTVTNEITVDEFGYPGQHYSAGQILSDSWQFQIPVNGMHTFHADHNWLRWYVKVSVEIEGWIGFKREYEVPVQPDRVPAQSN